MFISKYHVRIWKNDGAGHFYQDLRLEYTDKSEAIEVFEGEAKRLNAEVTRLDRELGTGRAVGEQYRVTLSF